MLHRYILITILVSFAGAVLPWLLLLIKYLLKKYKAIRLKLRYATIENQSRIDQYFNSAYSIELSFSQVLHDIHNSPYHFVIIFRLRSIREFEECSDCFKRDLIEDIRYRDPDIAAKLEAILDLLKERFEKDLLLERLSEKNLQDYRSFVIEQRACFLSYLCMPGAELTLKMIAGKQGFNIPANRKHEVTGNRHLPLSKKRGMNFKKVQWIMAGSLTATFVGQDIYYVNHYIGLTIGTLPLLISLVVYHVLIFLECAEIIQDAGKEDRQMIKKVKWVAMIITLLLCFPEIIMFIRQSGSGMDINVIIGSVLYIILIVFPDIILKFIFHFKGKTKDEKDHTEIE